jgi:hypothetical protein
MAFNDSGTYVLPAGNPVITGTTITSTWANNTLNDIATALTTCVTRDGQSPPTANLPMGSFKITGLAAATANGDAVRYEQVPFLAGTPLPVASGGTGAATLTANNVLLGNGTSAPQAVAPSTSGNVLTSNGTTWQSTAPAAGVTSFNAGTTGLTPSTATTGAVTLAGTLAVANGGTGTTSTTFANLATNVTGTLPVTNGGTGAATLTLNNVLLGNGTSAPQAVAPSTSGNVLTSNGTTWQSTAPSSGAMVLLSTVTASMSSSADIETTFNSTYDVYMIVGCDIINDEDTPLNVRMKIGGSYLTSTYYYKVDNSIPSTTTYLANNGFSVAQVQLSPAGGANNGIAQNYVMYIYTPSSATLYKTITWTGAHSYNGNSAGYGSNILNKDALTGIRFYPSSGVIRKGTFRLYGIAK